MGPQIFHRENSRVNNKVVDFEIYKSRQKLRQTAAALTDIFNEVLADKPMFWQSIPVKKRMWQATVVNIFDFMENRTPKFESQ